MLLEKHSFEAGMDSDSNPRMIAQNAMLNLMNARMGVTKHGRNFRIENTPGTTLISQSVYPPYGYNQCIGSATDPATDRMIFLLWNSFGYHAIYCYDFTTRITYAVLYDSQVDTGLNFSKTSRVNRNCFIVNGFFYWCEGENNEPRKVNIEAGIKANHSSFITDQIPYSLPISFDEITQIKKPPSLAPNIQKSTDSSFENNLIENSSFQFTFMYDWYDGEQSVVGTYSPSSRLNKPSETANFITVSMDNNQVIPDTVRIVNLIVRYSNSNNAFIVKTWDKEVTDEDLEIFEHNNGTQPLSFSFYNTLTGQYISPDNVLKPYDVVPIYAYTQTIAKQRNFLGNTVEGYDTPTTTSLTLAANTTDISAAASLIKNLIEVRAQVGVPGSGNNYNYGGWYVYLDTGVATGYYLVNGTELTSGAGGNNFITTPTLAAPPTTVAISGLTFIGTSQSSVYSHIFSTFTGDRIIAQAFINRFNTITITGLSSSVYDLFKTRASYRAGTAFYDFAMRKCGVVTSEGLIFEIPSRNFNFTNAVTSVTWALSNANALNEIPDWAYYYAAVRTLNLKTRFFIEAFTNAPKYATKDANGVYQYTSTLFVNGVVGIALNTDALVQAGLGYTFSEGDIAVLTLDDSTIYELPVIAQDGNYIIVKPESIGDLSNRRIIYQVYTPYQASEQEPFFEVGEMYQVSNPGTNSREYSVTTDIFLPDCYVLSRNFGANTYFAEAMSPNDLFYQRWDNDGGKVNIITKIGQVRKPNFGRFSNTFIPGTRNNGLSQFEALNQFNVSEDSGEINKLILTTKVQDEGTVMLAICRHETNSIYLGETRVQGTDGKTQFFAIAGGVIGTINNLKTSRGTVNNESVIEYLGLVFWIDALNGEAVQYSLNGLESVSRYNEKRFFQNYLQDYLAASTNNLDNINGFHHIPTGIDAFHKELLVGLPGLIYENYANTLPSFSSVPSYATSIINRFDIYDQLQKTMSFKFEENNWGSNFEYGSEWFEYFGNQTIGFKNGYMYIHNDDTENWNTFYGVERPIRICGAANLNPSLLKDLATISVESNVAPDFSVAMSNYPNIQITDLTAGDYDNLQGQFFASWFMDRLSPNSIGTPSQRLYSGDQLTDISIFWMLEFQSYASLTYINFVNIGWEQSKGQQQIANPVNK